MLENIEKSIMSDLCVSKYRIFSRCFVTLYDIMIDVFLVWRASHYENDWRLFVKLRIITQYALRVPVVKVVM